MLKKSNLNNKDFSSDASSINENKSDNIENNEEKYNINNDDNFSSDSSSN